MHAAPESITEFLTDGSLAALCGSLGSLTARTIQLRDRSGRLIEKCEGVPPWRLASDASTDALGAALASIDTQPDARTPDGTRLIPLRTAGRIVGALTLPPAAARPAEEDRLTRTLALVAQTVGELCDQEVQARRRGTELQALYELSSLLVAAHDVSAILDASLRAAAMFFSADAGTVHLFDHESHALKLRAWHAMSHDAAQRMTELPDQDLTDAAEASGRVIDIASPDATVGPAVRAAAAMEDLRSLISFPLTYRARHYGMLRLYGRTPLEFDKAQTALLRTIVEHVAAAVAGAELLVTERKHRKTQRHLQLAADVQSRMRSRTRPEHPAIDIDARLLSSLELAGDFYDIFDFHGHIGVMIGDVVGKGVPAALLMASLRAAVRAHALTDRDLASVIRRTNVFLTRDTLDQEFATLFLASVDPAARTLSYCNAGHEPPFLIRAGAARVQTLDVGGLVLGVDESQDYEHATVELHDHDTLVACTDGLVEAQNFEGSDFGRARLHDTIARFLRNSPDAPARAVADHAIWEVRRFIGLNTTSDDTTIIVMRVRGEAAN